MILNEADVAELVDARDLKCPAGTDLVEVSCKTVVASPIETDGTKPDLQNINDLDLSYENDRRTLHRVRAKIDADSPDGHTYSNILELMKNWEASRPGDFCQQHIPRLLLFQERRLAVKALPAPPKMLTYQPEGV